MIAADTMVLLMLGAQPVPRFIAEVRAREPDREITLSIFGQTITYTYPGPFPPVVIRERRRELSRSSASRWSMPSSLTIRGEQFAVASVDDGGLVLRVRPPSWWLSSGYLRGSEGGRYAAT